MTIQDGILYALMSYGPDCWYAHGSRLTPVMFDGERREIFEAIARLNRAGQAADAVTVALQLEGEASDLAIHIGNTGTTLKSSLRSYCDHLRQAHQTNRARDIGAALLESGDIEEAKAALLALDSRRETETASMEAGIDGFMTELDRREHGVGGLMTGLADLDRLLCGLEPADLCVVAARPSMGKTSLMLNIAQHCEPVGIFSLEMSTAQLMTRLVASYGIDYGHLRWPRNLSESEWPEVTRVTAELKSKRLWINDAGGMSIGDIEAESWRMVKANGVRLICVDYLQLVNCKAESRLESVSEVSRRLKALAKNLQVPVIAVSQMNRAVEKRGNPRPVMSDLRETGQIEQDADQIIFVYRPEVLFPNQRPGEADLIVAKNRGGEIGDVKAGWQGKFQRFVNLERNPYPKAVA